MSAHKGIQIADRKWLGYRPDSFDPRDYLFRYDPNAVAALPSIVDLRADCPPVMDQGNLGSCTAHGIIGALRYLLVRKGGPRDHNMSRLQLYYDERVVEGSVAYDSGAEIRDGIKCAAKIGVAHESLWPYKIAKFVRKPPPNVYRDAIKFTALKYERVATDVTALKMALSTNYPVVVGFTVFESFDAIGSDGVMRMPDINNEQILGGHCVYCVGYGQPAGHFICRNSWAADWGDKGDFYVPEAYLGSGDYGSDYWIVTAAGIAT